MIKRLRQRHQLGNKEIAFKDFRMGQIQRALPGYLATLDECCPGFSLHSRCPKKPDQPLFARNTKAEVARILTDAGFGHRKHHVNEKLLRIVHLSAFLTGLLAHDGQKSLDDGSRRHLADTAIARKDTGALSARFRRPLCQKGIRPLLAGAFPFEDRSLGMHDLLSTTDIVAGSLDQYLVKSTYARPPTFE